MGATCGAKAKSTGNPCQQPAGFGTDHPGFGKCKYHGGASPIRHGRYSLVHRQSLQEKAKQFLEDTRPGDLTEEIALMRALLQDFIARFPDGVKLTLIDIHAIYEMAESIGRQVERVSRMLNQTALTQAEITVLQITLSDLLVKYLDDPAERHAFMDELRQALGRARSGIGSSVAELESGRTAESKAL